MRISDWSSDVCSSDLIGAGRIERDLHAVSLDVLQHAVDTLVGGLQAVFACTRQTFRGRIDPDHPDRLQYLRTLQLVEQIGADVAGADDRAFDLGHLN